LPSFVIIGVQKAGTTSLYNMLIQHPKVVKNRVIDGKFRAKGPKELCYFTGKTFPSQSLDWYGEYFPTATYCQQRAAISGEGCPRYSNDPYTPSRLACLLPGVKLIYMVRDPIDRLISAWKMNLWHKPQKEIKDFSVMVDFMLNLTNVDEDEFDITRAKTIPKSNR